jgi:hypothetical protein
MKPASAYHFAWYLVSKKMAKAESYNLLGQHVSHLVREKL